MESATAIVLVSGALALGAPTCLCEASFPGPIVTKSCCFAAFSDTFCYSHFYTYRGVSYDNIFEVFFRAV